jgi:hypothetical protein
MALIVCSDCRKEISDKALSCPNCGAPRGNGAQFHTSVESTPQPRKRSVWKWVLGIPVLGFAALLIFGAYLSNTPEGQERANSRAAIELCWSEQGRKSNTPGSSRFIAGACEKMERDFREKWGTSP